MIAAAQVRRSKTHIVVIAALATLGGCAPLATVRETNPRLGAEYGISPQLQRAEQQIAAGQQLKASHPDRATAFTWPALNQQRANCAEIQKTALLYVIITSPCRVSFP